MLTFIGAREQLQAGLITRITEVEELTADNDGLTLIVPAGALSVTMQVQVRRTFDTPPEFAKGLGLTVGVVASGAWILQVTISFDDLDGPGIV